MQRSSLKRIDTHTWACLALKGFRNEIRSVYPLIVHTKTSNYQKRIVRR